VIVSSAPVRLSLAGGSSDLPEYYREHGCELLAAALNRRVLVRLWPHRGILVRDQAEVSASRVADLPRTLLRCVLEHYRVDGDVRVEIDSDVSAGSGLGWSGALGVALVGAIAEYAGCPATPADAAALAFRLEREQLGRTVGQQDPWAAALGGVMRLTIDTDGTVRARREPELERCLAPMLDRSLLMFLTPLRRSSSSVLDVQLRRLRTDGTPTAGAMHLIAALVQPFEQGLRGSDVYRLGEVLHTHWTAKRAASPLASTGEVDDWYAMARGAGAVGGKIIGAGGGGYLLFACPEDRAADVTRVLTGAGLSRVPVALEPEGLTVAMPEDGQGLSLAAGPFSAEGDGD